MTIAHDTRSIPGALTMRQDFDGGNQPIYIGEAVPGTAEGTGSWRIRKLAYTSDKLTKVSWADGSGDFEKVWTSRAGYAYN